MRVRVDPNLCQAYANCVVTAPDVFELDEASGIAVVRIEDPPAELHAAVEQAVSLCPTQAISADAGHGEAAA